MRWYFAIDEAGGMAQAGEQAKLAVLSARAVGGLEPVLLYYGKTTDFTAWMQQKGVRIINAAPSFIDVIQKAEEAGIYKAHSIGHWLRVAVPQVEQTDEFVLYTDCDVIFLRPFDWTKLHPKIFAAAPEFLPDNWNYFNAGVMLLNIPAMQKTYPQLEAHICNRIESGQAFAYDDEVALNEVYRGLWEKLDPAFNWKPYWDFNRNAAILHFHGPKLDTIDDITAGRWQRINDTAIMLGKMLDAHLDCYIAWCNMLGDHLQGIDFASALRFANTASALSKYRRTIEPVTDKSFMNLQMFPAG